MRRLLTLALLTLVLMLPAIAIGQPTRMIDETMSGWYQMGNTLQIGWVSGAMTAFEVLGLSCQTRVTVGAAVDAMRHRYLSGVWKGTDLAIGGLMVVLSDHGCVLPTPQTAPAAGRPKT